MKCSWRLRSSIQTLKAAVLTLRHEVAFARWQQNRIEVFHTWSLGFEIWYAKVKASSQGSQICSQVLECQRCIKKAEQDLPSLQ